MLDAPHSPDRDFIEMAVLSDAARCSRVHDWDGAIARLEEYVDLAHREGNRSFTPALRRIVTRLASLYRALDRYTDELYLIERYRACYPDDPQRTRLDARLSKLHAILSIARTSTGVPVPGVLPVKRRLSRLDRRARDEVRRARAAGGDPPAF